MHTFVPSPLFIQELQSVFLFLIPTFLNYGTNLDLSMAKSPNALADASF